MLELSIDQQNAIDSILSWKNNPKNKYFVFGGAAGTGKTTIISKLRSLLPSTIRIAFCAYTGKASSVLKNKLTFHGLQNYPNDSIGTIHSLIYEVEMEDGEMVGWKLKPCIPFDFIICDEASMVSKEILDDLLSFQINILFVGDHFQLPPIEGSLNLMENPDIKLEKVHRFAENNPITLVTVLARTEGYIPHKHFSDLVRKVRPKDPLITDFINRSNDFQNSTIICGFNKTRISLNQKIRDWRKIKSKKPTVGERVICLRNNRMAVECPIYNGVSGTLRNLIDNHDHYFARIDIDGEDKPFKGKISKHSFNNEKPDMGEFTWEQPSIDDYVGYDKKKKMKKRYLDIFDFSYAITCHKSQGSEWDRVMVIEQNCQHWSGDLWNRWLYTCVSRAKEELLIVR